MTCDTCALTRGFTEQLPTCERETARHTDLFQRSRSHQIMAVKLGWSKHVVDLSSESLEGKLLIMFGWSLYWGSDDRWRAVCVSEDTSGDPAGHQRLVTNGNEIVHWCYVTIANYHFLMLLFCLKSSWLFRAELNGWMILNLNIYLFKYLFIYLFIRLFVFS